VGIQRNIRKECSQKARRTVIRRLPTDQLAELVTSYRRVLAPLDAFVEHANAELRAAAGLQRDVFAVQDMLE
jgi:hypothetical protein